MMTIEELFKRWKESVLALDRKTVKAYERRLKEFVKEFGSYSPKEIKKEHLAYFLRKFNSESVREQAIASLGNFRRFLEDEDIPFPEVPRYVRGRRRKRLPKPIPERVFKKMIEIAEKEGREDRKAILLLLGYAGLRIRELLNILPSDFIKEGKGIVKITVREGKGGKDRVIPLPQRTGEWLWERRNIFPLNIHENTIRKFLKRYGKICGEENVHPHRLRHFYATYLTSKNVPLQVIQKLLGHSSPTTTMVYSQVADSLLEKTVNLLEEEEKACPEKGQDKT